MLCSMAALPQQRTPSGRAVRATAGEHLGIVALQGALVTSPETCELRGSNGERILLPRSVYALLTEAVRILAAGDAVTIVPVGRELTTQRAADLLNVSRQYVVRLLEEGKIPFTRTGSHRRLKIEDVLAFKEQRDRAREQQLDELAQLHEDLGGYDDE